MTPPDPTPDTKFEWLAYWRRRALYAKHSGIRVTVTRTEWLDILTLDTDLTTGPIVDPDRYTLFGVPVTVINPTPK